MIVALNFKPRGVPKRDKRADLRYRVKYEHPTGGVTIWGPLVCRQGVWIDHQCAKYRTVPNDTIVEVDE